jgi:hypothetical protein
VEQGTFQKCYSLENVLKLFFQDFFLIFDMNTLKPSENTKKKTHQFNVSFKPNALRPRLGLCLHWCFNKI